MVNYKLMNKKFIKLKETFGLIENTSDALIEFAITKETPIFNHESNQLVVPNGKLSYELKEGQNIYARPVDRILGEINVSEVKINNSGIDGDYYTKKEIDSNFVKKDGNKVLSDENFTSEQKIKLSNFNYSESEPRANGEASSGNSNDLSRADHVHPLQVDIQGNSGTSTKLKNERKISITGAVVGEITFDGSKDEIIETTLSEIDGAKINKLTGYSKADSPSDITPEDSLVVALGKLEGKISGNTSVLKANNYSIKYVTKLEYESIEKIQDDNTIYMILDEETGKIDLRVFRP